MSAMEKAREIAERYRTLGLANAVARQALAEAIAAALEDERRAALEEAAGLIETMNDPGGDRASYEGRDMTCCETERMHALSHAAAAIRANRGGRA